MTSLPFDAEAVRSLAVILADTGLTEIEIEGKEGRIRVVRAPAPVAAATVAVAPVAAAAVPVPVAAEPDDASHPGAVLSPMVGIAYLAPEPGAQPFVASGQAVTAGQTLLLIEAMKTFNQIKAPKDGVVTRILVTAGAPVEYGQPLMILE
ncbi:acetyl-CoA carboxylase biotin carboxyl carrier protein [Limobrevibacterium gyesilva]|uniref:Biotin carboxyl carrier protein of acetyl-CoA carboxylase n=1 Tax=Limobrevibacterium gyesilva TaxID=2991712 RepID=A0AA41YPS6_9PROT|nr:biotin/lipoyl-binding protein [Limobrevibacterium gyesilva]